MNAQSSLIKAEVDKSGATLKRLTGELAAFQSQQGISDFGTQMDLLLRRQSELQRAQQTTDATLAESSQREATIAAQLRGTAPQVLQYADSETDRRAQAARDSLAQLVQQETELRQTYTDKSRRIIAVREQIAAMRDEVARATTSDKPSAVRSGTNPVSTSLQLDLMHAQSELAAARESKRELQAQAETVQAQVKALEDKRSALESLVRQKLLAEQTYLAETRALGERQIAEDIDSKKAANVRVIEPAEAPLQASRTRLVILAGGVGLSLLVGITIGTLRSRFRSSFMSAGRIERDLGIPVLATVSRNRRLRPLPQTERASEVVFTVPSVTR